MANSKIPYVTLTTTMNSHRLRFNNLIDSVGDVSTLTTTSKEVVGAIKEHDAELGTISSAAMGTTASTVSTAIAELDGRLDSINTVELLTPRVWAQDSSSLNTFEGIMHMHSNAIIGGNATIRGTLDVTGDTTMAGDLAVNGGDITTTSTTANVVNTNATTVNLAGAGTTVNIGATSGTTTVKNNTEVDGTMGVDGATTLRSTLDVTGVTNLIDTTQSTVYTNGALVVDGGVGIAKNLNVQGALDVTGNVQIDGTLTVDGVVNFKAGTDGTVTIGDANTDNVVFNADINSSIIPNTDNAYDLGSSSQEWRHLYVDGNANIDHLVADSADISANLDVGGNVTVTGNTVMNGNVDLGNATDDTVSVNGRVDTNIVPSTDDQYDLGSPALAWKRAFVNGLVADSASFTTDVNIGGDINVTGTFTVGGDFVIAGAQKLASQYITLNDGVEGSPSLDAGIGVDRGSADSAVMHWDEAQNYWKASYDNTAVASQIITAANIDNSTLEFTSGTVNVKDNGVALGTKTTGNYVATIAGTTNEIEVTGSGSETAAVTIGLPDSVTITSNLTVGGNLTVNGTTTSVNTEEVKVDDNIIVLNNNATGTPTQDAGIEIERGAYTNAQLLWDESAKYWVAASDSANTLSRIATANWLDATAPIAYNSTTGNISHDISGVTANTYGQDSTEDGQYIKSITVNATGHITAITADNFDDRYDNYQSWTLAGDSGTSQTISSADTATIAGGTYITTTASATDTLTIAHDTTTRSDATSTASPAHGETFTVVDSVTTNTTGHVTAINVKTVTLPADNNTTYEAGTALDLDGTTFNLDLSELTAGDSNDVDFITIVNDVNQQFKIAVGNVPLSKFRNDAGWTSNEGVVANIYAGDGLTKVTSGADATLAVGAGTGVTVAADTVSIGQDVATTANVTFNQVTTATIARTGDLTLDASGDIYLDADGNQVVMKDASVGTNALTFNLGATPSIASSGAVSLTSTSNITLDATGDIILDADGNDVQIKNGAGADTVTMSLPDDGSFTISAPANFTLDATGDIILDADGNDIVIKNGGGGDTVTVTLDDNAHFSIYTPYSLQLDAQQNVVLEANGGKVVFTDSKDSAGAGYISVSKKNTLKFYTGDSDAGTLCATMAGDALTVAGNLSVGGTFSPTNLAASGTLSSVGNFSVNTNMFTVNATSGNTVVAGTLSVTGGTALSSDLNVNSGKFIVAASTGNTSILGTLAVSGNTTLSGDLQVNGGDITSTSGAISFGNENLSTTGTLSAGAITGSSLNVGTGSITGGALSVSSISLSGGITVTSLTSSGLVKGTKFEDYSNSTYYLDPAETTTSMNVAGIVKGSAFQDVANTLYYLDPASTTTSLNVAGAIVAAGDITAFSDARLKEDVVTIDGALSMVDKMRGVFYNKDGKPGTGVIAQEMLEVLPEVVKTDGEYMSVAYGNIIGVLIEAIKELKAEVEQLKGN